MTLDEYILDHITPEDDYLHRLWRDTHLRLLYPRMASGHLQGNLLRMLAQMIQPRRALEIGTYSGYSALSLAAGMPEDSRLFTFEINDEQEDFTRPWFENSPYASRIEFIIGNVFDLLPELGETFDLAFIDADKRQYCEYFELVMPHLRPGGFILADNTLWDGHVIDPNYEKDPQTAAIRRFNDLVARDSRVETVILPLRDGLTLLRKK